MSPHTDTEARHRAAAVTVLHPTDGPIVGEVPVVFDRDAQYRRVVRFGSATICPETAARVTINRVQYHLTARMVEESPGKWEQDRRQGYPLTRAARDGQRWSGGHPTDAAYRIVREWLAQQAPRLAEQFHDRWDAAGPQAVWLPADLGPLAAQFTRAAGLVAELAELHQAIRDGDAVAVTRRPGDPTTVAYLTTADPYERRHRAVVENSRPHRVTARVELTDGSGEAVGWLVAPRDVNDCHPVVVPAGHVIAVDPIEARGNRAGY